MWQYSSALEEFLTEIKAALMRCKEAYNANLHQH
jgi:hypothetical protein